MFCLKILKESDTIVWYNSNFPWPHNTETNFETVQVSGFNKGNRCNTIQKMYACIILTTAFQESISQAWEPLQKQAVH